MDRRLLAYADDDEDNQPNDTPWRRFGRFLGTKLGTRQPPHMMDIPPPTRQDLPSSVPGPDQSSLSSLMPRPTGAPSQIPDATPLDMPGAGPSPTADLMNLGTGPVQNELPPPTKKDQTYQDFQNDFLRAQLGGQGGQVPMKYVR